MTGPAKTAAVAAAQAQLAQAGRCGRCAQAALEAARANATAGARRRALDAQNDLVDAQEALLEATAGRWRSREREGKAARALKRKFFATMPVRASQIHTDAELDSETVDDGTLESTTRQHGGGSGIGVAVIDSGIEPGVDFGDRITAFYDFTQGDIRAVAPTIGYGHGTHVAGLIASKFVGVAPDARLIGLKVLDEQGPGHDRRRRAGHRVCDREQGRCSASTS